MNSIRAFRKKKGLTLKQLGEKVGVAESTLSKYENGINEPDLKTLTLIADALDATVDELLGRDEPKGEIEGQQIHTIEARILASGIDQMPKADRERALEAMRFIFTQYASFFERTDDDDHA